MPVRGQLLGRITRDNADETVLSHHARIVPVGCATYDVDRRVYDCFSRPAGVELAAECSQVIVGRQIFGAEDPNENGLTGVILPRPGEAGRERMGGGTSTFDFQRFAVAEADGKRSPANIGQAMSDADEREARVRARPVNDGPQVAIGDAFKAPEHRGDEAVWWTGLSESTRQPLSRSKLAFDGDPGETEDQPGVPTDHAAQLVRVFRHYPAIVREPAVRDE